MSDFSNFNKKSIVKDHKVYPYIENGRFYNLKGENKPEFLLETFFMLIKSKMSRFRNLDNIISRSWFSPVSPMQRSEKLRITWIGHASFLIQIDGLNILTDPIFYNASFLYPRILPPGIALNDLPEIDFIIISHNHRDHMDARSLNFFKNKNTKILVPLGNRSWFLKRNFNQNNIKEYNWWQQEGFSFYNNIKNIKFTFLPAYHWSQRGVFDYNKTLWGSWMISINNTNIYFAGDTGYAGHFKSIAEEFSTIDYALMPIGPCEPRSNLCQSHLGAEESVQAFLELKASRFIPMHWGTFYFGLDSFLSPITRLNKFWKLQNLNPKDLYLPKCGDPQNLDRVSFPRIEIQDQDSDQIQV